MLENGVLLDGIDIGIDERDASYRGAVATRDLLPGDVVVEVPAASVITARGDERSGARGIAPLRNTNTAAMRYAMRREMGMSAPRVRREALVRELAYWMLESMEDRGGGGEKTSDGSVDFVGYVRFLLARSTVEHIVESSPVFFPKEIYRHSSIDTLMRRSSRPREVPSMLRRCCAIFVNEMRRRDAAARGDAGDAGDADARLQKRRRSNNRSLIAPAVAKTVSAGAAVGALGDAEFYELVYKLATALVAGYSFSLGEGGRYQSMVPAFDVLNHTDDAECHVALRHDDARDVLQMVMRRPCRRGEEVFNCYGDLSSSELLWRYAFVPSPILADGGFRSRHDAVMLDVGLYYRRTHGMDGDGDGQLLNRLRHVRYANDAEKIDWVFRVGRSGMPLPQLLETVRIVFLPAARRGDHATAEDVPRVLEVIRSIATWQLRRIGKALEKIGAFVATDAAAGGQGGGGIDANCRRKRAHVNGEPQRGRPSNANSRPRWNKRMCTLIEAAALVEVLCLERLVHRCDPEKSDLISHHRILRGSTL